jgi:hypothetical protein
LLEKVTSVWRGYVKRKIKEYRLGWEYNDIRVEGRRMREKKYFIAPAGFEPPTWFFYTFLIFSHASGRTFAG